MRSGGCAMQQALTPEASAVMRQAVLLAFRRGHAQVTPLHLANVMLHDGDGLLRAACLASQSHPLQCKALELCFNVALNRLPASPVPPASSPAISNALVAAFKRAQAHQRRGSSAESQQQAAAAQLLALRIEPEQLVISILNDPSVSRVMREAGFSSTQVKNNVEKAVSASTNSPMSKKPCQENQRDLRNDDIGIIIDSLSLSTNRKRLIIVGESVPCLLNAVKCVMDRINRGEVPETLMEVKFLTLPPLYTFCNLSRDEVEHTVGEIARVVKALLAKGVVLYLGDFKWISEYRIRSSGEAEEEEDRRYYCSVEHLIMEIGRMVRGFEEAGQKFWLMGVATFGTYMRCKNGQNSLESVWGLHPVTIPANSVLSERRKEAIAKLSDCMSKLKEEGKMEHPSLPFWLKDESRGRLDTNQNQNSEPCKKWNSLCRSTHDKTPLSLEQTLNISYTPLSSSSNFSLDRDIGRRSTRARLYSPDPSWEAGPPRTSNLLGPHYMHGTATNDISRNGSSSNSASSCEVMEVDRARNFDEFNVENLSMICSALEKEVPSHKDVILEIARTILQCRSRTSKRMSQSRLDAKRETWLLFLGPGEAKAKKRISKELAKVVFGSYSSFLSIQSSITFDYSSSNYIERFGTAVSENPHRVFLLENIDQVDRRSKMEINCMIGRTGIMGEIGHELDFSNAIIIMTCEGVGPMSSAAISPSKIGDRSRFLPLDLNICLEGDNIDDDEEKGKVGFFQNVDKRLVFKSHGL